MLLPGNGADATVTSSNRLLTEFWWLTVMNRLILMSETMSIQNIGNVKNLIRISSNQVYNNNTQMFLTKYFSWQIVYNCYKPSFYCICSHFTFFLHVYEALSIKDKTSEAFLYLSFSPWHKANMKKQELKLRSFLDHHKT